MIHNKHLVEVKYLPATTYKGSRYKITSERFHDSITLPYDYSKNSVLEMAAEWLEDHGQCIIAQAEGRKASYLILDAIAGRFYPIKDIKLWTTQK